jgi:hypothetical protein
LSIPQKNVDFQNAEAVDTQQQERSDIIPSVTQRDLTNDT